MRRDYRNPTRKSRVANSGRAAPYGKYGENIVQIKKRQRIYVLQP